MARTSTTTPSTSSVIGQMMSDTLGSATLAAPIARPAPAAPPHPADEGDKQERDAEAQGAPPGPRDDVRRREQVRRRQRRDDRPEVEGTEPAGDQPRHEERDADREEQQRAGGLEGREQLAQQQQRPEHDQEDPE